MRFIEKLNTLTVVVVVFVFIAVVNGFLFYYYRYQPSLESPANVGGATVEEAVTSTAGTTTSENPGRTEATAEFVHTAASQNIVSNSTYIEDPSTLENPDAILLAERVSGPGANAAGNRPTGI